jgi:hypothetical protein
MSIVERLSTLIKDLRDENAFVTSEKKYLVELHLQVSLALLLVPSLRLHKVLYRRLQVLKKAEQLFRASWTISNQRLLLDDLIYSNKNRLTLNQYCTKYSNLTSKTQFVEAYKLLNYHEHKISEFLKNLRDNPKYLAICLVKSEKQADIKTLISIIFNTLYSNCLLQCDELLIIRLLKHLIDIQFDLNIDLRRLIRKSNCSFNIVFKYYTEFVFSTRLFLTAALNEPILHILMQDEWFYDIDPEKALVRFSSEERLKR